MADKEKEVGGRADGSIGIQAHHEEREALVFAVWRPTWRMAMI